MEHLLDYCRSNLQRERVQACIDEGSVATAAAVLNIDERNLYKLIHNLKTRASLQGNSPNHDMTHTAPDTHVVKGVSTLYGDEGQIKQQWVKTDLKKEALFESIQASLDALSEEIPKREPLKTKLKQKPKTLVNTYVLTDYHIGMMAWGFETRNDDWDLDIAEKMMVDWFEAAIKQSPESEVGLFAQLGDFLHWDGIDAVTPASKHLLDADTRFSKLTRVATRALIQVIDILLQKHNKVHIINATGNHDPASSHWLTTLFDIYFEKEPRVSVDVSADCFYCYEHGETSLFFHHGHKRKPTNVSSVFAGKFRDVFGRTKFSYGHLGHLHSKDTKEDNLMIIEQHQTLAAPDAYAAQGGWLSQRSAQVITYHKEYGEVSRVRITPEMLKGDQ